MKHRIRELFRVRLFRPFRTHLSRSEAYEVRFPVLALVGDTGVSACPRIPNYAEPDFVPVIFVSLLHVVGVERLDGVSGPTV